MLGPILIGISGTELDDISRQHLLHPAVGGVVLFSRNFTGGGQLIELVRGIKDLRDPKLLVCIDQEGGRVQRLRDGFTRLPPLGAIGKIAGEDSEKALDMAYRHGRVMATEMLAMGIDLSFAPVLDLDRGSSVIGDRAFSNKSEDVKVLGKAYLAGMHDAGMKTTGKHFPGHGSVVADSHVDDVLDPRSFEAIEASDLEPFRCLSPYLDAMMIAHVTYPEIDALPAGYSAIWLKQVLRKKLAYEGIIMSDDLGMHAAKSQGGLAKRARRCLDAGCDLVLVCIPDDVEVILDEIGSLPGDAGKTIENLYGRSTVTREELAVVDHEGIKEWSQWRRTLEELGDNIENRKSEKKI